LRCAAEKRAAIDPSRRKTFAERVTHFHSHKTRQPSEPRRGARALPLNERCQRQRARRLPNSAPAYYAFLVPARLGLCGFWRLAPRAGSSGTAARFAKATTPQRLSTFLPKARQPRAPPAPFLRYVFQRLIFRTAAGKKERCACLAGSHTTHNGKNSSSSTTSSILKFIITRFFSSLRAGSSRNFRRLQEEAVKQQPFGEFKSLPSSAPRASVQASAPPPPLTHSASLPFSE